MTPPARSVTINPSVEAGHATAGVIRLIIGVAAWPLGARGQQPALIGFLHTGSLTAFSYLAAAFREGPKAARYVEGQNVAIEYR